MRILWLKTELLHPVDKGGKIRTYQMLKELKRDHHITYLTLDDGSAEPGAVDKALEYAHEVVTVPHATTEKFSLKFYAELIRNSFSSLPYFMEKYVSQAMAGQIEKLVRERSFDVVVCDFLMPSVNIPADCPVPAVLFQHNVEALIWQRHYEVQLNPAKKAYLKKQWQRTAEYERETCGKFEMVAAVSKEDRDILKREYGLANVADIPTGVDTDFFSRSGNAASDRFNIVFTGSMDWLPNEDAIMWFTDEVLPSIREKIPEVSLTVVGRNPFRALVDLAKADPRVTVTGRVPDVRPYMERASVYIVPIRIGGGTRLKIYEAMAMGLPIVSTSVGAEGLPLADGDEILIRDEAADFADAVVHLLSDRDAAAALGERSARRVREEFGWKRVADDFTGICERAVRTGKQREKKLCAHA